jgi:hypothetical protein
MPKITKGNSVTTNKIQSTPSPARKTIGEMQSEPMSAWGNNDVITGLQFCATMQLRTPLRVLLRHGEIHTDRNTKPPRIALEPWEGIWLPKLKTFRELGVDMDEPSMGTMASDVGQIPADGGDYLPLLIAVREIVELHDSIESRIKRLSEMPMAGDWQTYLDKLWGMGGITGRFFPDFISTIPAISIAIRYELSDLGLFHF